MAKSRKEPGPTSRGSKIHRRLVLSAIFLVVVGMFYAEENWRGKRTWEKCKRTLRAQGIALDWTNYIPAAVPEDQNIFGIPEMVSWFHNRIGLGWNELARTLPSASYPDLNLGTNTARMLVAELVIGLPGTPAPGGFTLLRWNDPDSHTQAATMLNDALGPIAKAPQSAIGVGLMLRTPDEVQPARIVLQCQTAPSEKELKEFLPDSVVQANIGLSDRVLRFEPNGEQAYRVTMPKLTKASDYLAWSDGLEPQLALIRRALERPYSQLPGIYANPKTVPGPNFQAVRGLLQTLGARAQCHLLLGRPEEALDDNNPGKYSAINNPGPSTAFVFIDERADSINDGFFVIDMVDAGPQAQIGNIPADYHNGCSSVSFADGHVENHKWLDPRTEQRPYQPYLVVPNDPDIAWLQEHCCSRR